MKVKPLTRAELRALPPVTNLATLGLAFGVSEPTARERRVRGEWADMGIRVLPIGQQWRVVTADILRILGIDPAVTADPGHDLPSQHDVDASREIRAARNVA